MWSVNISFQWNCKKASHQLHILDNVCYFVIDFNIKLNRIHCNILCLFIISKQLDNPAREIGRCSWSMCAPYAKNFIPPIEVNFPFICLNKFIQNTFHMLNILFQTSIHIIFTQILSFFAKILPILESPSKMNVLNSTKSYAATIIKILFVCIHNNGSRENFLHSTSCAEITR